MTDIPSYLNLGPSTYTPPVPQQTVSFTLPGTSTYTPPTAPPAPQQSLNFNIPGSTPQLGPLQNVTHTTGADGTSSQSLSYHNPLSNVPPATPVNPYAGMSADQLLQTASGMLGTGTQGISGTQNNFSTGTNPADVIPSNALSGGTTQSDLLNNQSNALADYFSGNSNATPSTSLQKEVANQLYNSTLYSDQQKSDIAANQAAIVGVQNRKIQQTNDVNAEMDNGGITQEQGAGILDEINRRANQDIANLGAIQNTTNAQVTTDELMRQNQISALTGLQSSLAPTQVSPGSQLYNPITGLQYSGQGGSPQAILSQAQTLIGNDEATGNVHLTPDGQIDQAYYQQKAASMFGAPGGGASSGSASTGTSSSGSDSTGTSSSGIGVIPSQLQNYVIQPTDGTAPYINASRVDPATLPILRQYALKAGIPVLSADDTMGVQALQYANTQVGALSNVVNSVLAPGVIGRGLNMAKNAINNIFQNNPDLVAFNQARSTAIKTIQGLVAGGGSGFRLTQPEITTATDNLPTANDNLETAQTKVAWVQSFLSSKLNLFLTGNSTATQGSEASGSGSGLYSF